MTNTNIFNAKLNEFPTETIVRITYYNDSKLSSKINHTDITIPTADIFEQGDFVSRKSAGVKFSLVQNWLRKNNQSPSYGYSTLRIM